jgi:broad specificity phosphatase PhoE
MVCDGPAPPPTADAAAHSAEIEGQQHLAALRESGVIGIPRAVVIRGFGVGSPPPAALQPKLVHFVRHGQAYHNLIADLYRAHGRSVDATGGPASDPSSSPYTLPQVLDAPLTEVGRTQAKALRATTAALHPTLLVVSPLQRAVQTALLAFGPPAPPPPHSHGHGHEPPHGHGHMRWVGSEMVREVSGRHVCDRRRPLADIHADFPTIDFSAVASEEDEPWDAVNREAPRAVADRAYGFLLWLRGQPDTEVAVVSHSAILFTLLNAAVQCDSPALSTWFQTGELRSVYLTFEDAV